MSMQLINMGVRWQKSELESFSMTVNTALTGSANDTFILPLHLIDSVKVAWGDGTFSTHTTGGNVTHTYPASGIYKIKITGKASQVIRFNNVGDKAKLLSVDSFGDFKFLTADSMFYGCKSLTALDVSGWDVSNVTNMSNMFRNANSFNQDISNWDVSNVTNMNVMFAYATSFNQDLSQWCVRKILSLPINFALGSALAPANYPVWGTCPRNEDGLN